jgi:NAD(P)-dependent dehydrogenase (short-subunit alcohol dehydrogenase family)
MDAKHLNTYPRIAPERFMDELKAKTVLITGGGYGIGAAIAESFAKAGATEVILVGRTVTKLKETADALSSKIRTSTKITYYTTDITSKADVENLFASISASPDILINNAGFLAAPSNFLDADLEEYWKSFSINVLGTALVTQSFLRRRQQDGPQSTPAVVVTLNTIGAYSVRVPLLSSYGASKAALARWSELISVDVPEQVARFISVHPGAVKTEMGIKSGLDGVFPSTDPELAGDFVVWAVTEEAKFLSGRFAWVNWDVEQLVAKKEEIMAKDLLRTSLSV